jgi:hypothetical protein
MCRSAKAINPEALHVTRRSQRAIADQPGAEQRCCRDIVILIGQREAVTCIGHRSLGIAAIDLIAGEAGLLAQILPAAPAILAFPAGPAKPGNAHAVARLELRHVWADRNNPADDFMARDHVRLRVGQLAIQQMQIRPADAAGKHRDRYFSGVRLRDLDAAKFQIASRA